MNDAATGLLLRTSALRAIEAATANDGLMERAGAAVARLAVTMTRERAGAILVLAGPGNNGGDALVAARVLHERGVDVEVALLLPAERYRGDAADAWRRARDAGVRFVSDPLPRFATATLIVDGLFGIGSDRPPEGLARSWIDAANHRGGPILAIDVPSGVDADTGHVDGVAVVADRTITFLADKPGLRTGDALDHVGEVIVDALGVDVAAAAHDPHDAGCRNGPSKFAALRTPRRVNSHKGSNGSVAVIGGGHGMVGAALMAARMALFGGAGRVYVRLVAPDAPPFDALHPELMLRDTLDGVDATALAIGPGLGEREDALALLARWLVAAPALCVDADALNAVSRRPDLAALLSARTVPAVLTPHPLEAARLLRSDVRAVQHDRIAAATTLAATLKSVVVLKGAGTIVAEPDGSWVVNGTGNPALGTGGTGDVLCGLVAALLAQKLPPVEAARAAVWLHGRAADDLVGAGVGPVGLSATELIPAIRTALNRARA